jgi:hypothetical protein
MRRQRSPSRVSCRLAVKQQTLGAGWSAYRSNLGTPSRSTHGTNHSSAAKGRMATCDRECVRTATARKRSFRTGGSCDLMRARRRRWQIRVRAGATCEVRWARQKFESSHALQRACGCVYTRVTRLENESALWRVHDAERSRPSSGRRLAAREVRTVGWHTNNEHRNEQNQMPNQMPYGQAGACRMLRRLLARSQSAQS